jgi:hypothetical protein
LAARLTPLTQYNRKLGSIHIPLLWRRVDRLHFGSNDIMV